LNGHINDTAQATMDQVPEHPPSREADEPQLPGLSSRLLTQWWAIFESKLEKHRCEGKISRETAVTVKQFQEMVKLFLNVMGKEGQQNCKECLWAKRHFEDSVSNLSGTFEASHSVEDRFRALRLFLEIHPLSSLAGDTQERIGALASDEPCKQSSQALRKSRMSREEALRHEFLATMWFSEQCDAYTEKLKDRSQPSPEIEWLKQYSEARGRHTRQGVGYKSLFIQYLVDHSDPHSASLTQKMINKTKVQISNTRSDGRRFSNLYRRFGPGIFCYITVPTKTA
jgi:hypothetical protein